MRPGDLFRTNWLVHIVHVHIASLVGHDLGPVLLHHVVLLTPQVKIWWILSVRSVGGVQESPIGERTPPEQRKTGLGVILILVREEEVLLIEHGAEGGELVVLVLGVQPKPRVEGGIAVGIGVREVEVKTHLGRKIYEIVWKDKCLKWMTLHAHKLE